MARFAPRSRRQRLDYLVYNMSIPTEREAVRTNVIARLEKLKAMVAKLQKCRRVDTKRLNGLAGEWGEQRLDFWERTMNQAPRPVYDALLGGDGSIRSVSFLRFKPRDKAALAPFQKDIRTEVETAGFFECKDGGKLIELLQDRKNWTPDWSGTLEAIGKATAKTRRVFARLKRDGIDDFRPTVGEIEVKAVEIVEQNLPAWMPRGDQPIAPEHERLLRAGAFKPRLLAQESGLEMDGSEAFEPVLSATGLRVCLRNEYRPIEIDAEIENALESVGSNGKLSLRPVTWLPGRGEELKTQDLWCLGGPERRKDKPWRPRKDYVGSKTITSELRFQKHGKSPYPSLLAKWVSRSRRKGAPMDVDSDPSSCENYYAEDWIHEQIAEWNPRT